MGNTPKHCVRYSTNKWYNVESQDCLTLLKILKSKVQSIEGTGKLYPTY